MGEITTKNEGNVGSFLVVIQNVMNVIIKHHPAVPLFDVFLILEIHMTCGSQKMTVKLHDSMTLTTLFGNLLTRRFFLVGG